MITLSKKKKQKKNHSLIENGSTWYHAEIAHITIILLLLEKICWSFLILDIHMYRYLKRGERDILICIYMLNDEW